MDASYFRAVQGAANAKTESDYKSALAMDSLETQLRTSINMIEDAKRNGVIQPMIITASEVKYKYNITCMPGDDLFPGDMIEAFGEHFIVVNTRSVTRTYKVGLAWMCNVLFRFQNFTPEIIERWGVLDSGVYSTTVGSEDILTYLKRQFKIYLPSDPDTDKIYIDKRLAVGTMYDQNGNEILESYRITGRTKYAKGAYGEGSHLLELAAKSSEQVGAKDNISLLICDYIEPQGESHTADETMLTCEISGRNNIAIGGSRKYTGIFYDASGTVTEVSDAVWSVSAPDGIRAVPSGSTCMVYADNNDEISGESVFLTLRDGSGRYNPVTIEVGVF